MRRDQALDLFRIDDMLDEEERRVRDAVRDWVERRVLPHIEQWAWDCVFPRELVAEMADRHIGSAIVVKNRKLAGILSVTDVCRVLAEILRHRFPDPGAAA